MAKEPNPQECRNRRARVGLRELSRFDRDLAYFGSGENAGSAVDASMRRASIFGVTLANTRKVSWVRTAASTSAGQRDA
jgi:hypothetical protein